MKISNVLKFEFRKMSKDLPRLLFSVVLLVALLLISFICINFFVTKTTINVNNNFVWSLEKEQEFINARDYYQLLYDVMIGKEHLNPGGIIPDYDLNELLSKIRYYNFLLEHKRLDFVDGYSFSSILFNPYQSYSTFNMLDSTKLSLYQQIGFMLIPVFAFWIVYTTFRYDENYNFEKNYFILNINKKSIFAGKLLFSEIIVMSAIVIHFLLGFVFTNNFNILVETFNGFALVPSSLMYIENELLIAFAIFSITLIFIALNYLIKNNKAFILVGIVLSCSMIPNFINIASSFETLGNALPNLKYIPLYNICCSNGFLDKNIFLQILYPAIFIVLSVSLFAIKHLIEKHRSERV